MERLTKRRGEMVWYNGEYNGRKLSFEPCEVMIDCSAFDIRKILIKLADYEDTGLDPKDIISAVDMAKIACALHELNAYKNLGSIDHIRDLLQAETDGRLVVLPCKVGDTVYVIGEKRIMRCEIDEAYLDDKKGAEFLVSFDCDSDCDGCPFNSWRQEYSGEYSCDGEYGQSSIFGSDFGKNIFLSREVAEDALAQKEGTK